MSGHHNRILALDVIRGFALMGILIVNMMSFHSPILYLNPLKWWVSPWEHVTYITIDLFFQASFYPLFSLLFGYSLVIFRERVFERKQTFKRVVARRFCFLFMIGFIHAFFVWYGDILMVYAVIGFLSLPFLKMPSKLLIMFGSILFFLANSLYALFLGVMDFFHIGSNGSSFNNKIIKSVIHIYQTGSFAEITGQRIHDWLLEYNPQTVILLFFTVFPLFLIGAGLSKYRLLEKIEGNESSWKRFTVWALLLGLFCKALPYSVASLRSLNYLQDVFGGSLQASAYAGMIVIMLQQKKMERFLTFFSYVGKMSLTAYLFQSSLAAFVFYGYGLKLFARISLLTGSLLALTLFGLQVIFSVFWLRIFLTGPLEGLWRSFTYLKLLPWKRRKKVRIKSWFKKIEMNIRLFFYNSK